MNPIEMLLDRPVFQALGWTLIHFIWQGALIAGLFAVASVTLRRFSANARYTAACFAMLMMLVAPATTMVVISGQSLEAGPELVQLIPVDQEVAIPQPLSAISTATADQVETTFSEPGFISQLAQYRLPRAMPWLLALWFAGVLCLSVRFAGGLLMVQRLKRSETSPTIDALTDKLGVLSARLRVSRPVRLCESALVTVPTVIGWLRPVILLPASALTGLSTEQLEALLAHELAHIRRYDYLVNLLQTSIETLFFYHPAVWWVSAQVRQEREHCCDDLAVAACGDVLIYARALTALEQLRSTSPQLAVASTGGSLLVRIQRLLRGRPAAFYRFESGFAGFIAVATVVTLLIVAQASLLSRNTSAFVKDTEVLTLADMDHSDGAQTENTTPSPTVDRRTSDLGTSQTKEVPEVTAAPVAPDASVPEPNESSTQSTGSPDFISEMAAAGLQDLNPRELISLKTNGITSQFVREMASIVPSLNVNHIVAMRLHGVTKAYAEGLKSQGLPTVSADQLLAFKIHGVTADYIAELRAAGYGTVDPGSLLAFRIHGVTPAFIQQMKDFGYSNLTGNQLTAFMIHGVTPLFIQTMKTFVRGNLSANDLTAMRIHNVTPEFIKELEIMGIANLTSNQLLSFRVHGVTAAYIKAIQDMGYERITPNQLTELRIFGVTPDFIRLVKDRGFTDVTLQQLVELRRLNILPSAKKN